MNLWIFILLFATALIVSFLVLRAGTQSGPATSARFGMVLSAVAIGLWALITMSAFDVVTISDGQEFSHSYPELAVVGVIGGALMVVALFKSAIAEFNIGDGL